MPEGPGEGGGREVGGGDGGGEGGGGEGGGGRGGGEGGGGEGGGGEGGGEGGGGEGGGGEGGGEGAVCSARPWLGRCWKECAKGFGNTLRSTWTVEAPAANAGAMKKASNKKRAR